MTPILGLLLVASQVAATQSRYEITFPDTTGSTASVVADIQVGGDIISMRNGGNSLPQGFATFVTIRDVRNAAGQPVTFARDSVSRWKLGSRVDRVTVRYDIDFSFAREPWPSGNEQAAHWEAGSLYSVTKPFFVTGPTSGTSEVTFRLPAGWTVATPWQQVNDKPNTFTVASEPALTDNSLIVGRFKADRFHAGPFTFILATPGRTAPSAPLMSRILRLVAAEYVKVFPTTSPTAYLMTVFMGEENDGEAFAHSFAFRTGDVPTESNAIMWANTLAHELFHFWNGHSMRASDGVASAWLSEGVTEYYANRTLLRTGALPRQAFLSKAENMAGLYTYFRTQPMFDSVTLATAGSRRTRYRFGVYNGGWAAGFALDREISKSTAGRAGLDDLMRELFAAHRSEDNPYAMEEVVTIASRIAGKDMRPFFASYVDGKELIPMTSLFSEIGIDADFISYTGEGYFRFTANPSAQEQKEWGRYSGRSTN